jgi:hypothetical protein
MPTEFLTTTTLLEEGEKILSSNINVIMPTTGIVKTITFAAVFQVSNLYLKKINQTMPA